MKLSLIARWCLQNQHHGRRWAFRRLYSGNSEHEDELNHTEPTNGTEKETTPLQPPAELPKKKRGSSLHDLQSRLSLLEANILRAPQESCKELWAEAAKVCEERQQETVKGFDEVDEKMGLLCEKITGLIRDVETQTAVEGAQHKYVKGLEAVVDGNMKMLNEKYRWLIETVEALKSDYLNDRFDLVMGELKMGKMEWDCAAEKMEKVQEVIQELVRKIEAQVLVDLSEKVVRKTAEQHEEVVRNMEDMHNKVVEKMEEQCKEVKELLREERPKPEEDFDATSASSLSQIGTAEDLGLLMKKLKLVGSKLSVVSEKLFGRVTECQSDLVAIDVDAAAASSLASSLSEIGTAEDLLMKKLKLVGSKLSVASGKLFGRVTECHSDLVAIMWDIDGLSKVSERLRLLTKEEQEKDGVESGALSGEWKKCAEKMDHLIQGVREELQGLHALLVLREKEESAHRVTVDNQQMDASKRIWEELGRLQGSMTGLELEMRHGMEPIKIYVQKQGQLESTSGNDRANAVLVTISSAFLACSTAICAWTLHFW